MSSDLCGSPPPVSEPDDSKQVRSPPTKSPTTDAPPPLSGHADEEPESIEDQPCPPDFLDDDVSSPEAADQRGQQGATDSSPVPEQERPTDREDPAIKQSEEETKSESSTSTIKETADELPREASSAQGSEGRAAGPAGTAVNSAKGPAIPKPVSQKKSAATQPAQTNKSLMKKAPLAANSSRQATASRKVPSMMRINQQPPHHQSFLQPPFCRQESFGEGIKTGPSDNDSDSEISDAEHFLAKGAFLLTPSHELSLEKASAICEKMNFNAPFSLTKTATGILFKFARPEDYQATFKKGFHKVTGARFYKKIPIPCRPQKTFTVFVLEVPEEVPEEDIRHALYKFHSVVEVVRLAGTGGPQQLTLQKDSSPSTSGQPAKAEKAVGSTVSGSTVELGAGGPPPLIRVTLANLDEYSILLQNGLDFFGATFFPTESASPSGLVRVPGGRKPMGNRILDVVTASGQRVRDLLPVFDAAGFSKIPPPAMKTIKPRPN